MYLHRRRLGGHKHGGSKHTNAAGGKPTMSARKPPLTATNSGKHVLPTKTTDVRSLHLTHRTDTTEPMATRMSNGGMSSMHTTSLGQGKPLPTENAKGVPSMTPKGDGNKNSIQSSATGAMTQLAKPHKSPSLSQKIHDAPHKPIFWAVLIGVFVLFIAVIMVFCAIKKRKRKRINDEKTKTIMQWHRNQGLC